eukprot:c14924_g1_i1.p1 GENE.c14924_g1_i1~~c14924_g1_i1.p1  ORF type:complete len:575 (+),score=76.78 c14924_g1_i1:82-1725(+)
MSINNLPNEILCHIFSFVDLADVTACAGVCKKWRHCVQDPSSWRTVAEVFDRRGEKGPLTTKSFPWATYTCRVVDCLRSMLKSMPAAVSDFPAHPSMVTCLSLLPPFAAPFRPPSVDSVLDPMRTRFLATGANDCTVRIWDTVQAECLASLERHTSNICCVAWAEGLGRPVLVSGGWDKMVNVWDLSAVINDHIKHSPSMADAPPVMDVAPAHRVRDPSACLPAVHERAVICVHATPLSKSRPNHLLVISGAGDGMIIAWTLKLGVAAEGTCVTPAESLGHVFAELDDTSQFLAVRRIPDYCGQEGILAVAVDGRAVFFKLFMDHETGLPTAIEGHRSFNVLTLPGTASLVSAVITDGCMFTIERNNRKCETIAAPIDWRSIIESDADDLTIFDRHLPLSSPYEIAAQPAPHVRTLCPMVGFGEGAALGMVSCQHDRGDAPPFRIFSKNPLISRLSLQKSQLCSTVSTQSESWSNCCCAAASFDQIAVGCTDGSVKLTRFEPVTGELRQHQPGGLAQLVDIRSPIIAFVVLLFALLAFQFVTRFGLL